MTFIWLFPDFMTFLWLYQTFTMTFSWLSHDFLMTFPWLSHEFLITFSRFYHDSVVTFSWLSNDLVINFLLNFLNTWWAIVCALLALVFLSKYFRKLFEISPQNSALHYIDFVVFFAFGWVYQNASFKLLNVTVCNQSSHLGIHK